jgi:sialate O-acetylesterase
MKTTSVVALMMMLAAPVFGEVKLPGIIGDHMVLQRDRAARIWGWASPSEEVKVEFNGQKVLTHAQLDGTWSATLTPLKAGGPYELVVIGKNRLVVRDVLVGEVWVASGQSNMAVPVAGSKNADAEIAAANFPQIRHFRVSREPSDKVVEDISGQWKVCSPSTAGNFTAVGYYFARFLHGELKVPVGIINSSWGGTPAEAWTPLAALKREKINRGLLIAYEQTLPRYAEASKEYQAALAKYERHQKEGKLHERQQDPGNKGYAQGWAKKDFADTPWPTVELPRTVDDLLNGDGGIWFRREVTLPETWAGHPLMLSLGIIDDYDATYWNGSNIGNTTQKTNPTDWYMHVREYAIPGHLVTAGRTVLAVRVFDDFLDGGFMDVPENMYLKDTQTGQRISLAGAWRWKLEVRLDPAKLDVVPSMPLGPNNPNAPGTLFNALIYPLRNFAIRGAIWYQGESNVGRFSEYPKLLSTLIQEWRAVWNEKDFPFGIVQLANFLAVQPDPNTGSAWAALREAQFTVSRTVPNTGIALAIDIGEAADVHPKNKQDVGRRLGLWALAKVYGHTVEYSGPIYKSMKVEGNKIRLSFDHVGGGLVAKGGKLTGFAVAGADQKFVRAEARIDGENVVAWSDKVAKPAAIRYAWADNPICNLYNKAGLPASPFRTDE